MWCACASGSYFIVSWLVLLDRFFSSRLHGIFSWPLLTLRKWFWTCRCRRLPFTWLLGFPAGGTALGHCLDYWASFLPWWVVLASKWPLKQRMAKRLVSWPILIMDGGGRVYSQPLLQHFVLFPCSVPGLRRTTHFTSVDFFVSLFFANLATYWWWIIWFYSLAKSG